MAVVRLGGGDDTFRATEKTSGFSDGSAVHGGNGDDAIAVGTGGPRDPWWSDLFLSGGNGDDDLVLRGGFDSVLQGGPGDDVLRAQGDGNLLVGGSGNDSLDAWRMVVADDPSYLFGGPGDDILRSSSPPIAGTTEGPAAGNVMTGGPGRDSFVLNTSNNVSDVRATNDDDGTASAGDVVIGTFNVVTDYETGESLVLGAGSNVGSPVEFDATGHPIVPDGQYAALRGDLSAATEFVVDPHGDDLLIVFDDAAIGTDQAAYQGSVVLLGVTDADTVLVG